MDENERVEIRDGREFRVVVLPEATPKDSRSPRSRYKLKDVGKQGSLNREPKVRIPRPML